MEDLNLHLTGDVHAISLAHNLLARHGGQLDHPRQPARHRPADDHLAPRGSTSTTAPSARSSSASAGGRTAIRARTAFDISVASEVMAILGPRHEPPDLRARLGGIVVALDRPGARRSTAEQLRAAGAMAVLRRDAIKTDPAPDRRDTPAFVHAGPFGNIGATGHSSVLADSSASSSATAS